MTFTTIRPDFGFYGRFERLVGISGAEEVGVSLTKNHLPLKSSSLCFLNPG